MDTITREKFKSLKELDKILVERVFLSQQEHVFHWWDELSKEKQRHLLNQLGNIDFALLQQLVKNFVKDMDLFNYRTEIFEPPNVIPIPKTKKQKALASEAEKIGEAAIRAGMTSIVTVAGGMGTRLSTKGPKGALPISPVMNKSIFQLHAEKILANMKKYDTIIPWYIMTCKNNDEITRRFFKKNKNFGLMSKHITFFKQEDLPVVDYQGNLLLDSKSNILTSPDGHGGTFFALEKHGLLSKMKKLGIKHIFYHQVDNILIKIVDPVFLGYHIKERAKMSPKAMRKFRPNERVGVIGIRDGRLDTVEYTELSEKQKNARRPDGKLTFWLGNPAIYLIDVNFIERISRDYTHLPYHKAVKKVPVLDGKGVKTEPDKNNAVKFEMFVFDALKYAGRSIIMEVERNEEFAPVKDLRGVDSINTSRQDMVNQFGSWLRNTGIKVPINRYGNVSGKIEISPLYALDAEELKRKLETDKRIRYKSKLNLQ